MHGWNNDILYVWSFSPIVFRFYPCIFCFLLSHWSNLAGSSNPTNESEGNRIHLITDRTRKYAIKTKKQKNTGNAPETPKRNCGTAPWVISYLFQEVSKCLKWPGKGTSLICKGTRFWVRSPIVVKQNISPSIIFLKIMRRRK